MPTHLRALFIGNSFTARNDVPALIAAIAESKGHTLSARLISRGGASLRMHYNGRDALPAIQRGGGKFDTVILQEQSTLPVKNAARMHESIRLFDAPIRAAGARMVLYLTWARRHSPEAQAAITDAYTSIARELGATVAPAGIAWEQVLKAHPQITLHDKDQSHPTPAGSYLAACTLFAVLFNESPLGAPAPSSLDPKQADVLQKGAWHAANAEQTKQQAKEKGGSSPAR
ncbi:MAG: hypothetical protein WD749_09085 [Phycisphaerales bacterium]